MADQNPEKQVKTCFVAMPITTPHEYVEKFGDKEHFAHILTHLFTPAIEDAGLTVIPPSAEGSELIHAEIIKNLEQADFVLCDLSSLNPNVLFELGVRTALDRPIILVKDNLTDKIPFDLSTINTVTYEGSMSAWSVATEMPRLSKHIQGIINSGTSGNSMWRYFGLTKRGEPSNAGGNPIEDKLDLLMQEVAMIRPLSTTSRDLDAFKEDPTPASIASFYRALSAILKLEPSSFEMVRASDGDKTGYRLIIPARVFAGITRKGLQNIFNAADEHNIIVIDVSGYERTV